MSNLKESVAMFTFSSCLWYNKDPDVNDYNMLILMERGKHNEIAKLYRLTDKKLSMESFIRDLRMFDYRHSVVTYIDKRRTERLRKKEIDEGT